MVSNNIRDLRAKLLIIGDSQVGKTSLLTKFTEDIFKTNVQLTVGKTKGKFFCLSSSKNNFLIYRINNFHQGCLVN